MNKQLMLTLLLAVFTILPLTPAQAQLRINEFMASNSQTNMDPQGEYEDWIEIFNDSEHTIDLAGFYLTDDLENLSKWQFPLKEPELTTIPPHDFLLIWADGDIDQAGLHAGFKLSSDGEEIALVANNGTTILDSVVFPELLTDQSYGRDALEPDIWRYLTQATPGSMNASSYIGTVSVPTFSHERGFYENPFTLEVNCDTPDAEILYTTNGEDPLQTTGPVYKADESGYIVRRTTVIRAVAVKQGYAPSKTVTHSYLYRVGNAIKSLPVYSLVGSPGETFYAPNGVMAIVGGTYNGGVWQPTSVDNYNNVLLRGLERPVSFELLHPGDSNNIQVDCGLRVHGSNWMRPRYTTSSKFSFRLYFRGQYGPSWLDYPLFPFEVDRFKSIVLRGGHNDKSNPFIKDELTRRLLKEMGHVSSGGSFANLFINGVYKGYYNPCEHITEAFCQSWFDSNLDWDIITMGGSTREGDRVHIETLVDYIATHDLAITEYYEAVAKQVDIDEFIDYLILRLWAGDWDWPHNNWSAARERSDEGLWRFFVWDGEGGMFSNRLYQVFFDRLHVGNDRSSHENAYLYSGLYNNPRFRIRFGDRIEKHFSEDGVLSADNITAHFQTMQEEMRGVIPNMNTYVIDTWVPQRKGIFLNACRQEGVYTFSGPQATLNGTELLGGYFQPGDQFNLIPATNEGIIYYTTDGTDPIEYSTLAAENTSLLLSREATKYVHVPATNGGRGRDGESWLDLSYNHTTWQQTSGLPGGVGYERNSGYESHISLNVLNAMQSNTSCYIRIPFTYTADDQTTPTSFAIKIQYDDGFVAYLNGTEIARRNFSGTPTWNSNASSDNSDSSATRFEAIDISDSLPLLQTGNNVLAIHGLNRSTGSSDFLINAELTLGHNTPLTIDPELKIFKAPLSLTESTHIKARVLHNNQWSSLTEGIYTLDTIRQGLRISEIMYHPEDTGDPNDANLEFIELKNTSTTPLNLALVKFTDGIDYPFPSYTMAPNELILVVRDLKAFTEKYGRDYPVIGQYQGSLNNSGEWIALQDAAGQIIQRFQYRDDWFEETDGAGFSLTVKQPGQNGPDTLSNKEAWEPSLQKGGSPGWEDSDIPVLQ